MFDQEMPVAYEQTGVVARGTYRYLIRAAKALELFELNEDPSSSETSGTAKARLAIGLEGCLLCTTMVAMAVP